MNNLREILVSKGIAPSIQRIKILEYLKNFKTHPTADMIYKALIKEIPTLSKTTVYNTLKQFTEKGILSELSIFENEMRYEYDKMPHAHFKCTNCGKIYDISGNISEITDDLIDGHLINEKQIYFKGICRECRNN